MPHSNGRVSFLVAGVQKGGTSALFEYLSEIAGLQLPEVKEAHFFDDESGVDWSAPDYRSYHDLFVDDGLVFMRTTGRIGVGGPLLPASIAASALPMSGRMASSSASRP